MRQLRELFEALRRAGSSSSPELQTAAMQHDHQTGDLSTIRQQRCSNHPANGNTRVLASCSSCSTTTANPRRRRGGRSRASFGASYTRQTISTGSHSTRDLTGPDWTCHLTLHNVMVGRKHASATLILFGMDCLTPPAHSDIRRTVTLRGGKDEA